MFATIFNALPKIKSFARAIIVLGNFVLEVYHIAVTAYRQGQSAYSAAATAA